MLAKERNEAHARAERAEAALRKQISGRTLVPELIEKERENLRLRAEVERLREALAEWRKHDSSPDCVACAVLDAATCGTWGYDTETGEEGKP